MIFILSDIAVPVRSRVLDAVSTICAIFARAFEVESGFWLCALSILRFEAPQSLQRLPTSTGAQMIDTVADVSWFAGRLSGPKARHTAAQAQAAPGTCGAVATES